MESLILRTRLCRETFVRNEHAACSIGGIALSFPERSTFACSSCRRSGVSRQARHSTSRLEVWIAISMTSRTIDRTIQEIYDCCDGASPMRHSIHAWYSVFRRSVRSEIFLATPVVAQDCLYSI